MSRRWASLVLVALGLALDLSALPASAQENCFFVVSWSASGSSCGSGKKYMARVGTQVRECATGGARTHDSVLLAVAESA